MGTTTSSTNNSHIQSRHSVDGNPKQTLREHKRHGVVTVKINAMNNNRRNSEAQLNHVISPKGAILYGTLFNPTAIQKAIQNANFPMLTPGELAVPDSRAHKLFVSYCNGWHVVPFPEVFSRHSGTCYVVGDRNSPGQPYQLKVGDCFRLGSVGLVVSEMKLDNDEEEQKIDAKTLQFLKDEALAFDTNEELALLASDEMGAELDASSHHFKTRIEEEDDVEVPCSPEKTVYSGNDTNHNQEKQKKEDEEETMYMHGTGLTNGEKYICYMCYETHNTTEDPLVAPCDCKGDTRFLHVQCLQKWYHSTALGQHGAQVIRTTGNGAPACKICGAAYKTNFRRADGRKASILEMENDGPYLSLVVVTHHDTNPGLFNTKFRLNFGRRANNADHATEEQLNTIIVGRSSTCTMILDYRTVSTIHAKITYQNGKFFLSDQRSSNGTMVYIRDPLPLPYATPMKIRMGRTTITLQAKRTWTAAMRAFFFGSSQTEAKDNVVATSSVSVDYGNNPPDLNLGASAVEIQHFLASLQNIPGEKHDLDGGNMNNTTLMNFRSYTIRTINDAGSVDGAEGMDEDFQNNASQRYDHYAYLSQQLASLAPPGAVNVASSNPYPSTRTSYNNAINGVNPMGGLHHTGSFRPLHGEDVEEPYNTAIKNSPRMFIDSHPLDELLQKQQEALAEAELSSIAWNGNMAINTNVNNVNNNNKSMSGNVSPTPVTNISANTLVAGSSASIVVMGNIEESHLLQNNTNNNMAGNSGNMNSSHETDGGNVEENIFNTPAAGVFAIPNNNSTGNLAASKV